ncbi:MAG: alpha/beta fold hydrolase [Actinomycetes bacterium]
MTNEFELPQARATGVTGNGTSWSLFGHNEKSSDVIVLIHGVGMSQAFWAPQIHGLLNNYCVLTYDMWGHGATIVNSEATALPDFAAQLIALLDELHISQAHVVGHSLGALVAIECATRYPQRCVSLVALNAVFQRTDEQRAPVLRRAHALVVDGVMNIDQTLDRWFEDNRENGISEGEQLSRRLLESVNASGYANAYMVFATAEDQDGTRLSQISIPALFATGDADPNSTPEMSHAMSQLVPDGRCVVLGEQRHMMSLTAPIVVTEMIRQTVSQQDLLGSDS